jgi:hypothetical protein
MSDKTAKIPTNNAVPCRPFAGIELRTGQLCR